MLSVSDSIFSLVEVSHVKRMQFDKKWRCQLLEKEKMDERHPKMEKKYTAGFKTLMVFHTQRVLVLMLGWIIIGVKKLISVTYNFFLSFQ